MSTGGIGGLSESCAVSTMPDIRRSCLAVQCRGRPLAILARGSLVRFHSLNDRIIRWRPVEYKELNA
jgi:hypothetical protein